MIEIFRREIESDTDTTDRLLIKATAVRSLYFEMTSTDPESYWECAQILNRDQVWELIESLAAWLADTAESE